MGSAAVESAGGEEEEEDDGGEADEEEEEGGYGGHNQGFDDEREKLWIGFWRRRPWLWNYMIVVAAVGIRGGRHGGV